MKVCVLLPDYSTSAVDYQYYDPPRNLAALLPNDEVEHVFLNKLTTYKQLKELSNCGFDIFVNLCEGYLEWEVPSIDVIHSLELLNLPYTGPTADLYDPPKEQMKYVAYTCGVKTPLYSVVRSCDQVDEVLKHLRFPMFVKPAKAGDSLGVDEHSLVLNSNELLEKISRLTKDYGSVLVEEYIDGREFTVLVAADSSETNLVKSFVPVEYRFPKGTTFKTYALKTSELHTDCNFPVVEPELNQSLRSASEKIFRAFNGKGYARLDFRVNANNEIFFLEINFTCSVFYQNGYEGSADYILQFDPAGQKGFLNHIIQEGIYRFQQKQASFTVKGNAIAGYGIYSNRFLPKGTVVFKGEEKSQRLVTKRYVDLTWSEEDKKLFRQYAYPVSSELFLLWSDKASDWAPQNHSCKPNTRYQGLNVVAIRNINPGEELTLDYADFLDEHMLPFECSCGAASCRKIIRGVAGNSITVREQKISTTIL